MFSIFMELVKRVGIFVIIGQTILHFGISKKYEKYMKLVISFMVGAQIVFAFGVYLKQDKREIPVMSVEEYMQAWEINMEEMEKKAEMYKSSIVQNATVQMEQKGMSNSQNNNLTEHKIRIEKITLR